MPRDPYGLPAFRVGDQVREPDGRHVGTVRAILHSRTARVRWNDTGWISDLTMDEIEAAP